ncbi:MAG: hypothetical protein FJ215_01515 [Ignavibacteria bacterium]|nr:hypothetical protein [Ignavibacteria bacterium]
MPKPNRPGLLIYTATILMLIMAPAVIAHAQVEVDIQFPSYDVVYLADFVDPTTGKLSGAVPNVSFTLSTSGTIKIYLVVNAHVRFADNTTGVLLTVPARTSVFELRGTRVITSRDLSGGTADIKVVEHKEDESIKKRLEDHAKRFPTAPVGTYSISVDVISATGGRVGGTTRSVNIQNAATSEVQVTLIDPLPGAAVSTPFPTFSWTSDKPQVTLYVYEKLRANQSPEEAITGVPHLTSQLTNQTTLTYPPMASRRLEPGKSYFWYVETAVSTNRGVEKRQSEIRLFRIVLDNAFALLVDQALNSLGGQAAGTMATLSQMGWVPKGNPTVDGRTISREELRALLNALRNYTIRVESQ